MSQTMKNSEYQINAQSYNKKFTHVNIEFTHIKIYNWIVEYKP